LQSAIVAQVVRRGARQYFLPSKSPSETSGFIQRRTALLDKVEAVAGLQTVVDGGGEHRIAGT